ncbi:methyltransferase domain-containing protein [Sciscionella sediminilitoris]|uniref:methyltransferase domain-containing protein n=1 Tax=Sciscionella sediminilitoris TaxID=1445613 RepID=UPI0004DF221F|nr:methyltransferase domain-containing protein [Sciscionella sp. SE31]
MNGGWRRRSRRLTGALAAAGLLTDPRLGAAFREVPRHVLVPVYLERTEHGWRRRESARELATVYSDTVLVTAVGGDGEVLSTSSQPGVMARMLESLALRDGMRVLEIGTGSGYNAALLCHRLGAGRVYSIDVEPELVATTRDRLAGLGYHPNLAVGDGSAGLPEHAPFDRVLATCAVPAIPFAWVEQCRIGGVLLGDLKPVRSAGNLVRLVRVGRQRAQGRFERGYATFMDLRQTAGLVAESGWPPPRGEGQRRESELAPGPLFDHGLVVWFLACLELGPGTVSGFFGYERRQFRLATADGSLASVSVRPRSGVHQVREYGPRQLWRIVEAAHEHWVALGKPGWDAFGLTVTPERQTVWFGEPGGEPSWVLGSPVPPE